MDKILTLSSPKNIMHTNDILAIAKAQNTNASTYYGALNPQQAYQLLQANPQVKLIDVRTNAERDWVGKVDISPTQHFSIEWKLYPEGSTNPQFLSALKNIADEKSILLFLCRSGVRSQSAARLATEHGYAYGIDILNGFEGDKDAHGHRKTVNGWCFENLPWIGA